MSKIIATEFYSACEAFNFVARRPKDLDTVLGLYVLSIYGIDRSRTMRAAYLPIRHVDDAIDGDDPKIKNPLTYANNLKTGLKNNTLGKSSTEQLLQYAVDSLERKSKQDDDPRGDFIRSIDSIIFDGNRAANRSMLTEAAIELYYHEAFDPVINITLMALDSDLRSKDLPALSYGQGKVYSARDLKVDWQRGIINIPVDVLAEAQLSNESSVKEVVDNDVVTEWFKNDLETTKPDLLRTQQTLLDSQEKQTIALCGRLVSSMLSYIATT
jgi:phytoene/squalene synthetase